MLVVSELGEGLFQVFLQPCHHRVQLHPRLRAVFARSCLLHDDDAAADWLVSKAEVCCLLSLTWLLAC